MSSKTAYSTPPESFVHPPLTPPASHDRKSNKPTTSSIAHIIRHLRLRQAGHSDASSPWTVFPLSPDDAEQLFALLKADEALWGFVQDKVRYDYISRSGQFILRMPTTVHEWFRSSVVIGLQRELDRIAIGDDNEAAEFARLVQYRGSPKLHFLIEDGEEGDSGSEAAASKNNEKKRQSDPHEPDAIFEHLSADWPGVIIEISFSQKKKMLKDLAEDYIFGSNGSVRVVVGLDIEYRQSKMATISVWRPLLVESEGGQKELMCEQTVEDQAFRDAGGNPIGDGGLELYLRDFAPSTFLSSNVANNPRNRIVIPSCKLLDFLIHAELKGSRAKEKRVGSEPFTRGTLKRRRERTPVEELRSEDERIFETKEKKAAERAEAGDREYVLDESD